MKVMIHDININLYFVQLTWTCLAVTVSANSMQAHAWVSRMSDFNGFELVRMTLSSGCCFDQSKYSLSMSRNINRSNVGVGRLCAYAIYSRMTWCGIGSKSSVVTVMTCFNEDARPCSDASGVGGTKDGDDAIVGVINGDLINSRCAYSSRWWNSIPAWRWNDRSKEESVPLVTPRFSWRSLLGLRKRKSKEEKKTQRGETIQVYRFWMIRANVCKWSSVYWLIVCFSFNGLRFSC